MKTSLGTADLIKFLNKTKTEICKNRSPIMGQTSHFRQFTRTSQILDEILISQL